MSWPFLASGPITAVFLFLLNGSVAPVPLFSSSTIERPAALRAALMASGFICADSAFETST